MTLLELTVSDLALIERVRVPLGPGFTVVTGETGAGKSLLIDALGLVTGARGDQSLVRPGASATRVEALFEREPEPLIAVREVTSGGRSLARLDDETVTVGRLAATLGPRVEVHGQHEQQRLLSPAWQRDLLDAYGGLSDLRGRVADAVEAWRGNEAALLELAAAPEDLARRIELAEHAAGEIEAAAPRPGEVAEIRAQLAAAANAERIGRLSASVRGRLADEGGAREQLALAAREADELARLDPRRAPLTQRINGLAAEVADVADDVRRLLDEHEADAAEVAELEERLGRLYGLMRKYGDTEEEVLEHARRAREESAQLRGREAEHERRARAAAELETAARAAAQDLTVARREVSRKLSAAADAALQELGFGEASFGVELAPAPLDRTGADAVTYVLAPNPGEPARPLGRIASGGELSRVALAVKSVLAEADTTPTLVFDEVDAGIGGRSADPIGRRLWQLARRHQVLCVTHLPQIAAYADRHLRVEKRVRDGRTVTEVAVLDPPERRDELAHMLGGGLTGAATAAAEELLERAARAREAMPREPAPHDAGVLSGT